VAAFSVPPDFASDVCDRLVAAKSPPAVRYAALAVLGQVSSDLATQSYACRSSVRELAQRLGMVHSDFIGAVRLLGEVGAVSVVKHRGERRLAVTVPNPLHRGRPRQFESVALGARTFGA
jgi:hypothetical protein